MSMIEVIKEAVTLARKYDNIELTQELLTAEEDYIELKRENLKLREEVNNLREQLKLKPKISWYGHLYWIEEDELTKGKSRTPICNNCYDKEGKVFRLSPKLGFGSEGERHQYVGCHNCKFHHQL